MLSLFLYNCVIDSNFVKNSNLHPTTDRLVPKELKEQSLGHTGGVFWLYGLSGSGKSTLAIEMEKRLHHKKLISVVLDGDNLRSGLNSDLGFSDEDRKENIRRISEVAKLFSDNGMITLVSLISPKREFRENAKNIIGAARFHEIYIKASFAKCQERDVKGLYAKAADGRVTSFTGLGSNFEEPAIECLTIDTEHESLEDSANRLFSYIKDSVRLN